MPFRKYLTLGLLSALLLVGCQGNEDSGREQTTGDSLSFSAPGDSLVYEMQGIDSLTVFDILSKSHAVEFVSTASGVFVKSIDSVENSSGCFWIYSVNDTMAQVAADQYRTSDGDLIRWHYRKMTP